MTNWIDDEAEKQSAKKAELERKNYLINFSNYWGDLIRQIGVDIETMNRHPAWNDRLGRKPIKISGDGGGYEIRQITWPAIIVRINNQGNWVEIKTTTRKSFDDEPKTHSERLKVNSDGERIYLESGKEILYVPEEASQYILKPIVDSLV